MEVDEHRCELCRREPVDVRAVRVAFCTRCAARVGELALASRFDGLVWRVDTAGLLAMHADPATEEKLETHADLGCTYLEIGLLPDALREAAWVLSNGAGSAYAKSALDVLLDERVAYPDALDELRRRLFPS